MNRDYSGQAWAFVMIFGLGAAFKTVADWRVAVAHEALLAAADRVAAAQERAHPTVLQVPSSYRCEASVALDDAVFFSTSPPPSARRLDAPCP